MPARKPSFTMKELTKGNQRKLKALQNGLGDDIGLEAFDKWYKRTQATPVDKNAQALIDAVEKLGPKIKIPRQGYVLKRWKGRVTINPAS